MAEKKASLTVLGGPLAGTRFVLEDAGPEVLLGSDPACRFQLALTGVSPLHARLQVSPAGFTIEDAGSDKGLHVNDGKVTGATPLRNGDIVWLGTPGEADVVMLQCILPARPPAPAPPPPAPVVHDEDETLALALEQSEGVAVKAETIEHEATLVYSAHEVAAASVPFAAAEAEPTASPELVVGEDETVVQGNVPFVVDAPPPPPAPAPFEDDTKEQTFVFEEESPTVLIAHQEPAAPPAHSADADFVAEEQATAIIPPPEPELEPTVHMPPPPAATAPPPPPRPEPPPRAAAPAPTPPAPRPARPAPASVAARKPAPRPQPPPRVDDDAVPPAPGKASSSTGLYVALGLAGLAAVAGGVFVVRKVMSPAPPTTVAVAPPPTAVAAPPRTTPTPPPAEATPAPVETPIATPATPVPLPTPVAVAPPTTTLKGAPTPAPTPATKKAPTPPPVTTPAGPSPEQVRAQQVANLLGQADSALAAGQYDQAIGHLDEVLRLDPGNGKATADRASAASLRDASKKKFVSGRTVVKTEKAGSGISGFEGADVQRTPDFSGRIEFEMSPASGLRAGDAWTLKVFLVNDGKKNIKVGGVTANTSVNGAGAGAPVAAAVKEVTPQQRIALGQITGSWKDGTSSWSADVLVTANKGDSLKNTLTWR